MARLGKYLTMCLVVILAVSSILITKPANAQSSPVIIVTPIPQPLPTPTATTVPTMNIAMDYSEISRVTEGENTRLVLAVNATYNFGEAVTINFQDFTLSIAVERGGPPVGQPANLFTGTAKPNETGNVTIAESNSEVTFQLTFVFSTLQNNAHGQTPFTIYELKYSASTATYSPTPTPTVPEFPIAMLLVTVLIAVSLLLVMSKKKLRIEH